MMKQVLQPVAIALTLAVCLALVPTAMAGWNFQYTPVWSSGHGGYSSAYFSGGVTSSGYSGYSGYSANSANYGQQAYAFVPPVNSGIVGTQSVNTNDRSALIDIRVPSGAKIWFDGKETAQGGESRSFVSPPLNSGSNYTYGIRATWKEGGRTIERKRQVTVHAGDRLNLNLATPSRSTTPVIATDDGE